MRETSSVIKLSPVPGWSPQGWYTHRELVQCWSLLLADWALGSGHSQVSPDEWESTFLCPCITSIPATMATLLMSQWAYHMDGWEKRLTAIHRTGHPILQSIKTLLPWGQPLLSIHMRYQYLHMFCPLCIFFDEVPIYILWAFLIVLFSFLIFKVY